MSISLIIPTYTLNQHLADLALCAAKSYREQVDQLIITEDGGEYSEPLKAIADIYIYNKVNESFTKNVNKGWKLATGDYHMIVNSDTRLFTGKLIDLCIPGIVTSPHGVNQGAEFLWGAFWCTPKAIRDSRGMLREEMKTYYSDVEYDNRVRDIFKKIETVQIEHVCAQTVNVANKGADAAIDGGIYNGLPK